MEIVADRTERLYKALQKFIYHVDRLTAEEDPGGTGFHREYRDLREISIRNKDSYEATHGKIPINIRKNRYKDIVPYDKTRVTLSEKPGIPGSDYINANFILDAHQREGYIASQGPLPHTLEDFWRMISEYKVKVVMMACREVEAGKKKCAQYWVEEGSEKGRFGEYEVACVGNEKLADDCDERHLQLITGDSIQEVYQYHYTGWPDHGIPDDIDVILEMIKRMRDIRSKDPDHAPVVVHCSAGCGRTGTICAIDYAWEILKSGLLTEDFSLYDIVENMRTQRQSMVQTPEQYEMAHRALKELFQKHIEIMNESEYVNIELNRNSNKTDEDVDEDDYVEAKSNSRKLQLDALDTVNIYAGSEDVSEVPKEEPLTIQPKKEEQKVIKVVANSTAEQKIEKEKLQQKNLEKEPPKTQKIPKQKAEKEPPKTQQISQQKAEKEHIKTQKISKQKVENEPSVTKKQKMEKESILSQNEEKDGKDTSVTKTSYENFFTENYENTQLDGEKPIGSQLITQRQSSFEEKMTLPASESQKFMAVRPLSESTAAKTSKVSLPDTVPRNITHSQSSGPQLTGPTKPSLPHRPEVQSGPRFVASNEQPTGPKFVSQQSGPRFVSSSNSQEKTQVEQNEPKFKSVISFSSTATDIIQGNVPQNKAKDKQTLPNSENYELAQPITEPTVKTKKDGPSNIDSVYAVPDKNRKEPTSSTPSNMYSEVSKGNTINKSKAVPYDAAYETIAMTESIKSKPGRQYEEVSLTSDGLYSTVGDIQNENEVPPIPKREYQEPEPSHDNSKISVTEKLKSKVTNTLFNIKGSSEPADTSTVPGFNQRLEKKVKGPRTMPWSKKTKL